MSSDHKKIYRVPFNPIAIVTLTLCSAVSGCFWAAGMEGHYPKVDWWFLCLLGALGLILQFKTYVLWENQLVVTFFGIAIRKIPWENFSNISYFKKWKYDLKTRFHSLLLFTIKPAPPCNPNQQSAFLYKLRHPGKALFIEIPPKCDDAFIAAVEQCYGPLNFKEE